MKSDYNKLIKKLKSKSNGQRPPSGYSGNNDPSLGVRTPVLREIAKDFVGSTNLDLEGRLNIIDRLIKGKFSDEKYLAGKIIEYDKELKNSIKSSQINKWLEHLTGWCQIDTICQSNFKADDLLNNWQEWETELIKLSKSDSISKRRASLVLLTKSTSQVRDERLKRLAFKNIDRLKNEDDKLITKAVSWLLRSMIKHYRKEVERYLDKNSDELPAIAVRETKTKLKKGTKN
jgi:3-methyladenine DNA glycosylase AlkD